MTRGRKAKYETAADKQRAYRERHAKTGRVTKLTNPSPNIVTKPVLAIPVVSQGTPERNDMTGAVYAHCEAAGLLVRVLAMIDATRVKAEVLQPGTSHLIPGWAYPFRADLLAEVTP